MKSNSCEFKAYDSNSDGKKKKEREKEEEKEEEEGITKLLLSQIACD